MASPIAKLKEVLLEFANLSPLGAVRRDTPANSGEANGAMGALSLDDRGRLRVVQDADAISETPSYGSDSDSQQLRLLQLILDEQRKTNVLLLALCSSAGAQVNNTDLKETVN